MKNVKNLIMVLVVLLIGVLIGSTTTQQANAQQKEVFTTVTSVKNDGFTVQDKNGKNYNVKRDIKDRDQWLKGDTMTIVIEDNEPQKKLEIINTINKPNGDIIQEFSNGSYSLINEKENIYIFQAIEFGDYEYNLSSKEDLNNFITTYKSIFENGYY